MTTPANRCPKESSPSHEAATNRGRTRLHLMHEHPQPPAFGVGQAVSFRSRAGVPLGTPNSFTVKTIVPIENGLPHYRIRSTEEAFDRMVPESNLIAADQCQTTHDDEARRIFRMRFMPKRRR
ncbi:hypothetical protein ACHMW7_09265 [Aminobacter sp. UC22_36]|uniref:hypothetical protein n=1 Tax=Aminobacter sp. UC22_36 TaxID=3374549 RepID=UPI003756C307